MIQTSTRDTEVMCYTQQPAGAGGRLKEACRCGSVGRVCDSHTVTLQHTVRVLRVATD